MRGGGRGRNEEEQAKFVTSSTLGVGSLRLLLNSQVLRMKLAEGRNKEKHDRTLTTECIFLVGSLFSRCHLQESQLAMRMRGG